MGDKSTIQWCDSTLNLQMGCDGCELWNHSRRICYAGRMIDGDPSHGKRGFAGGRGMNGRKAYASARCRNSANPRQ